MIIINTLTYTYEMFYIITTIHILKLNFKIFVNNKYLIIFFMT